MTTDVILTGTGVPHPSPGRAGPGTLVRHGGLALQFDAGRGTVLRLAEAGTAPFELSALFVTHVHSDHVIGIADVALTRWLHHGGATPSPLPVIAPVGAADRFVRHLLEPFADDIALRMAHAQDRPPEVAPTAFVPAPVPTQVWESGDGSVRVLAVAVHHEPADGVAYRVETPDGAVVISGDTRVCQEVEHLCAGADLVVHEACRTTALADAIAGTIFQTIFSYHADTVPLGTMAELAGVPHLVLTHLIPQPVSAAEEAGFEADLRRGGYSGRVTVGRDLLGFRVGGSRAEATDSGPGPPGGTGPSLIWVP